MYLPLFTLLGLLFLLTKPRKLSFTLTEDAHTLKEEVMTGVFQTLPEPFVVCFGKELCPGS